MRALGGGGGGGGGAVAHGEWPLAGLVGHDSIVGPSVRVSGLDPVELAKTATRRRIEEEADGGACVTTLLPILHLNSLPPDGNCPKEEEREKNRKKDFLLEMRIAQLSGWTIFGARPQPRPRRRPVTVQRGPPRGGRGTVGRTEGRKEGTLLRAMRGAH